MSKDWLDDLTAAFDEPLDIDLDEPPPVFPPGAVRRARQMAYELNRRPDLPPEHVKLFVDAWDELIRQREERLAAIKCWDVVVRLRQRASGL